MNYYGRIANSEVKEQLGKRCTASRNGKKFWLCRDFGGLRAMARSGTRSEMPDHGACWFSQGASQQRTRTWGSGGIL